MRKLLILSMALLCQIIVWAQGGQTATLHHGGEFKTFYSAKALGQALAEAQPGDIINLSAGVYEGTAIKVPVTVRGAGIGSLDSIDNVSKSKTIITGAFNIDVPADENGNSLSMEGIICDNTPSINSATNAVFSKMRMSGFRYSGNSSIMDNLSFIHCIFDDYVTPASNCSISIYNSIFANGFSFSAGGKMSIAVYNCLFLPFTTSSASVSKEGLSLMNCIIDITGSKYKPTFIYSSYTQCYNCLYVGGDESTLAFKEANASSDRNNRLFPADSKAYIDGTYYRLTDEAAAYLGDDDTQVGIYGTSLPFSIKTSYPQIKKFYVAPESTADGKLKIEIEIDAAD